MAELHKLKLRKFSNGMRKEIPGLLISDRKGKIFTHPYLEATGMKGNHFFKLETKELVKLPFGSKLFMLPDRAPVGYCPGREEFMTLYENPFSKQDKKCFAVAAFASPGFTTTYNASYVEAGSPRPLPLFSYGAAVLYKGCFYIAAVRVDKDRRHDSRFIDIASVRKNIKRFKKIFFKNRLVKHLEECALVYGCPGAQNFFLSRYECQLPASPVCNARCAGCISYQSANLCPASQARIKFIPTPGEISEIALFHIDRVKDPVLSFGQGCEGEPLLVGDVIEKSIKLIRKKTEKGIINMNTNASRPDVLEKLFDVGLGSIRVSLNSARELYYSRYYKSVKYTFGDVISSIKLAKKDKVFVSINYLTMPGFTDLKDEFNAFKKLIAACHIDMVQWRNLNFDPKLYFKNLKLAVYERELLGIREIISSLKKEFPNLMMGYFNPSRSKIRKHGLGK